MVESAQVPASGREISARSIALGKMKQINVAVSARRVHAIKRSERPLSVGKCIYIPRINEFGQSTNHAVDTARVFIITRPAIGATATHS